MNSICVRKGETEKQFSNKYKYDLSYPTACQTAVILFDSSTTDSDFPFIINSMVLAETAPSILLKVWYQTTKSIAARQYGQVFPPPLIHCPKQNMQLLHTRTINYKFRK